MPPPAPTAPDLRAVKLVLTAGCNLRCSYCYQSDKKNLRIDWEIVRATLDRLLASARSDVELLFIGGEPLLEFPTIELQVVEGPDRGLCARLGPGGMRIGAAAGSDLKLTDRTVSRIHCGWLPNRIPSHGL